MSKPRRYRMTVVVCDLQGCRIGKDAFDGSFVVLATDAKQAASKALAQVGLEEGDVQVRWTEHNGRDRRYTIGIRAYYLEV